MTKLRILSSLTLLLLCVAAGPVLAQGAVSVNIDDLLIDVLPKIEALVTVRDDHGVPIVDLQAGDFEIVEDGQASFPPR
jgi:hypothetical protein